MKAVSDCSRKKKKKRPSFTTNIAVQRQRKKCLMCNRKMKIVGMGSVNIFREGKRLRERLTGKTGRSEV